jgi:MFS family permease
MWCPGVAALLLVRQAVSAMDLPTRQAYTMALVAPEERTGAASVTSLARSAGAAVSPILSGLLLAVGLPFMLAGAIQVGYDLSLWRIFRRVPIEDVSGGATA